ncbi:hypothetical protein ABK040_015943 [Willaertia magna]
MKKLTIFGFEKHNFKLRSLSASSSSFLLLPFIKTAHCNNKHQNNLIIIDKSNFYKERQVLPILEIIINHKNSNNNYLNHHQYTESITTTNFQHHYHHYSKNNSRYFHTHLFLTMAPKKKSSSTPNNPTNNNNKNNTTDNNNTDNNNNNIPKSIQLASCNTSNTFVIHLTIFAKPNSSQNKITQISNEEISIQIAAQPKEGEANKELCEYISDIFSISKSKVNVDKGGKSKNKIIVIELEKDVLKNLFKNYYTIESQNEVVGKKNSSGSSGVIINGESVLEFVYEKLRNEI